MFGKNQTFKPTYNREHNVRLEKAKKFPIENLYIGKLKKTGKVWMGLCPFHEERTPSFAIYPETNTYNCFAGCGGGDVIDFYMKLNDVNFSDALEVLSI